MDAKSFDALAKTLSRTGTRRGLIRVLGGASLSGAMSAHAVQGVSAATLNGGSRCRKGSQCKTGKCLRNRTCSCSKEFPKCPQSTICCKNSCQVACRVGVLGKSFYGGGFAFQPDGTLLVFDYLNSRIVHLSATGNILSTFGRTGASPGRFGGAMGIAIDGDDNVYVADNGNERIQKFDSGFTHVDIWSGRQGPDGFGIRFPYGIAIGPGGNVYVADGGILKFKPDSTFLKGWRGGPTNDLPFAAAQLAFDQDGNLFVVDRYEHRVQKFDPSDTFVAAFGELGTGPGELDEPFGITIDFQGRVHVADSRNNRVQVFDRDGRFLFGWGSEQLTYPEWLGVDKQGNILVTGRYMKGVQKFKVKGLSV